MAAARSPEGRPKAQSQSGRRGTTSLPPVGVSAGCGESDRTASTSQVVDVDGRTSRCPTWTRCSIHDGNHQGRPHRRTTRRSPLRAAARRRGVTLVRHPNGVGRRGFRKLPVASARLANRRPGRPAGNRLALDSPPLVWTANLAALGCTHRSAATERPPCWCSILIPDPTWTSPVAAVALWLRGLDSVDLLGFAKTSDQGYADVRAAQYAATMTTSSFALALGQCWPSGIPSGCSPG